MKESEGGYTIVLVPSDTERTRSVRLTPRGLRIGAALAAGAGLALALLLGSWWYFAAQTARIPELEREIARLEADNAKVAELAGSLAALQREYEKVRAMLGGDILAASAAPGMLPSEERGTADEGFPGTGLSPEIPTSWPLATSGFVTQTLEAAQDGTHPGIDIAVAQHSYIRASGAGVITEAGADSVYGLYVLIEHGNTGYQTMYGHASRLFVAPGDTVLQNQVIALSGNTGRSTAPHLHFEILQDQRPIDPFTLVQQISGT
ncbi:MAG: peptidoglycan DD-metalloendopeptidase family protein [Gemmatimonadota bacterium]|nr:MAG: peptidoglycan DD-metalloendopeptidase family protein [Gemmatimonadota bacterium]